MATAETQTLLNVVGSLQSPVQQDVKSPFEEAPLVLRALKRSLSLDTNSFAESHDAFKAQYLEAINIASQFPFDARLETFNSLHQKYASYLINVFFRVPLNKFQAAVEYAKTKVNIQLLNYALSVALLHREDSVNANIQLPSHVCTSPEMYFDIGKITKDMYDESVTDTKNDNIKKRFVNVNSNFTGTNQDPEHKVAYFREDIGLNLHHRHWHEVYPFNAEECVVKKDRRGELFYYMHQQIVARYNFERLSNHLPRAEPYSDFRKPIKEAYFPKLDSLSKETQFSSRPANAFLSDLHREFFYVKLSTMERWRDRIFDAIDRGYAYVKDPISKEEVTRKIEEPYGIDELGNSIEAVQLLSWNYDYYGDLHNKGHIFFSYCHDPDNRFRENGSVMSHSETALRDPIFYRWHVFIDDIFQHYKRTLKPYTLEERQFQGINLKSVKVCPQENEKNIFKTFWQKDAVDVTQGILNLDPKKTNENVFAVFTHLQHEDFEYKIEVENSLSETVTGTVRIFLAPHKDESSLPMNFNGQRRMFIEMDKFTAQLDPGKVNTITRQSTQSSVTIPFEKSFMTLNDAYKFTNNEKLNKGLSTSLNGYCGCGWPHHLLVGKGSKEGFECDLFVMITDYEQDKVEESPLNGGCCEKSSISYCGIRNKRYPDKKPMGFPFDRDIANVNATLLDFMTENQEPLQVDRPGAKRQTVIKARAPRLSNMMVVPVTVQHLAGKPRCGASLSKEGYTDETCRKLTDDEV